MGKNGRVDYKITYGTEAIPFIKGDVSFLDEKSFTDYLDRHKWANAPMAFPQINLLIGSLDPTGCKCNNWRDHLKVLLAHGFDIQAHSAEKRWVLKKSYYPVCYQAQDFERTMMTHIGYFFHLCNQTADDQFPKYCEAADYPPGTMRTIMLAYLNSGHTVWATTEQRSEILIRANEDGSFFAQEETMTYLGETPLRLAQ